MATLINEGFNHYSDNTHLTYAGYTAAGTPTYGTGRYGRGRTLILDADADSVSLPFTDTATIYAGVNVKMTGLTGAATLVSFTETGTLGIAIQVNEVGTLAIYRGTTLLEESAVPAGALKPDVDYYLEVYLIISQTVGAYELWVNGESIFSDTNVDTFDTTTAELDAIKLHGSTARGTVFDDLYVNDTTGGVNDARHGEFEIIALRPNAVGSGSGWTPLSGDNYASVDDNPGPDTTTTYVAGDAVGETDSYELENLPASFDTILHLQVKSLFYAEAATTATVQNQVLSGATEAVSGTITLASGWHYHASEFLVDPATAVAWEDSDIDLMEAGVEMITT